MSALTAHFLVKIMLIYTEMVETEICSTIFAGRQPERAFNTFTKNQVSTNS